jgi:hypothetical protein
MSHPFPKICSFLLFIALLNGISGLSCNDVGSRFISPGETEEANTTPDDWNFQQRHFRTGKSIKKLLSMLINID